MSATPKYYKSWRDVAVFEDWADARGLKDFLAGLGFKVRTYDDKWFRRWLFLRPPQITWRVQICDGQQGDAGHLLHSVVPSALERALHCPACGSLQINYPQMTRKFLLPTVLLHAGILLRIIDHQCYCEHCHEMWSLPGQKPVAGVNIRPAVP